ncbi:ATP-binding protein [Hoeflea sp.]|uniref:sensor histidine kinase n=1 Tax=Hoeflea sp. TaxID=1940281 RepID=UPI003A93751E
MTDVRSQFEQVMDHLCFLAFLIDLNEAGEFVFRGVNSYYTSVTTLTNEQLKGQRIHDVLPVRTANTLSANYAKCVETRALHKYEELLNLETGETWWLTTLSPVFGDDGAVVGIIGITEDITAYKERQFNSLDSVMETKRLSEEISLFTALAAHDLRGPLRQINLVTELVEDGFEDFGDGKPELLTMIKDVAARALEKLDEVLRHARSFIGESDTKTVVDFGHLCADLVAILDPMSRIKVSYPEAHILVEAVALQVELRNILDNAIKHARSRILIELKQSDAAENMLEVRVSDDGPGFADPDSALNLAKPATADPDKGFGLETVARLATSRGGKVWIGEPELGKGATICWTIDATIAQADACPGAAK